MPEPQLELFDRPTPTKPTEPARPTISVWLRDDQLELLATGQITDEIEALAREALRILRMTPSEYAAECRRRYNERWGLQE